MLFSLGGAGYMGIEVLWRGWSHGSMFLAGGSCFLLLGLCSKSKRPLPVRAAMGACMITGVELLAGLLVNRNYSVWDYRAMPLNFRGQVCLPFTLLWLPLSLGGMLLHRVVDGALQRRTEAVSTAPWPFLTAAPAAAWARRRLW